MMESLKERVEVRVLTPERVPTPEEAEVLRAVDDGEPWAMKSPEAGECAKAGWIGNGHDGPGLTPSGCAALARFEAQEAAREKAARGPQPCEYCNHDPGCGLREGCDCAVCCHDPMPDDGGDVIDWRARALAAEAEVKAEKAAHDGTREALRVCVDGENALTAEVAKLRAALERETAPRMWVGRMAGVEPCTRCGAKWVD